MFVAYNYILRFLLFNYDQFFSFRFIVLYIKFYVEISNYVGFYIKKLAVIE